MKFSIQMLRQFIMSFWGVLCVNLYIWLIRSHAGWYEALPRATQSWILISAVLSLPVFVFLVWVVIKNWKKNPDTQSCNLH